MLPRGLWIVWLLCGLSSAAVAPTWADDPGETVEAIGSGTVNWTTGIVTATGIGAPPANAVNATQAKTMAERAAFLVATRNLLETVKGIRVDSVSLIENMLVKSDVIRSQVTGLVKGARAIKTEHQPDGGVEVTVAIALNGELVDALLPKSFGRTVPVTTPSSPAKPPVAMAPAPPSPAAAPVVPAPADAYTGLIVDARGLGLKPALAPRLLDEQGQELYAGETLSRDQAVQAGVVGYTRDMVAGSRQPRVTDNPLVVKGSKVSGQKSTDIVLGADEVRMIRKTEPTARYLQQARVVVVCD